MLPSTHASSPSFLKIISSYFQFLCTYYSRSAIYLSRIFVRFVRLESNCLSSYAVTTNSLSSPICSRPKSVNFHSFSNLSVFYSNVKSVIPKLPFLKHYVSLYSPSILAITETWLSNDIPSGFLDFPNYSVYRKDRIFSKGGGTLLLLPRILFQDRFYLIAIMMFAALTQLLLLFCSLMRKL